jgi:hypothetical protein
MLEGFASLAIPIVIVTSEFGTVSMWDWEIRDFLSRRGVPTLAPTSVAEYRDVIRSLGARRTVAGATMLAYQDDLGGGKQPDIFKRFYWWEDECVSDLQRQFGIRIQRRSFRELARRAAAVPASRVDATALRIAPNVPMVGLVSEARANALRLYLALSDELDEAGDVVAAGINCLNESATSPTTPCLAWNLLFEERGIIWGCEADLTSMITKTRGAPVAASAGDDDEYLPVPDGTGGAQAREDPLLPRHCPAGEPHPGCALRLLRRRSAVVRDQVDSPAAGPGDCRPARQRHRRAVPAG